MHVALVLMSWIAWPIAAQQVNRNDAPPRILGIRCGASSHDAPSLALRWHGDPVQWAEWRVALGTRGVATRVIVARFDPRAVQLSLEIKREGDAMLSWSLDDAPPDALIALNAGQFTDGGPWGWVVHRGREWQAPGRGSLAGALVVDSTGTVTILDANTLASRRAQGGVMEAIQSYPTLLDAEGVAPSQECTRVGARPIVASSTASVDTTGVDRTHRDTRLAVGTLADGRLLVVLSQYDGAGTIAARLPIGPTTPEMAEIMRRLGAQHALMLDGGLSAQMLVRTASDSIRQWPGLRRVPLALLGRRR